MSDSELFVRCDCGDPDHMLVFDTWHWDEGDVDSYVSFSLSHGVPWYKRVWYALKYVFTGKTTKHWWPEVVLTREKVDSIIKYLNAQEMKGLR